jgi:BirA family biotin operon repressor/biotin-[acetyl-CoA-carboxylase] ligase
MTELPPDEIRTLDTRRLGRCIWVYRQLDSTNTRALAFAGAPSRDGLVLQALEQTAGRGQHGRSWQAASGSSVLMSVLLFLPPALRRPSVLTAWAAVSVCDAIATLAGHAAQIKWPNDVLLDGKKVGGILIEQRTSGHAEHPLAAVVGIGLNVTQTADDFAAAGLTLAGSVFSQSRQRVTVEAALVALIRQLDEHYDLLVRGDCAVLETRWRAGVGLIGQRVRVEGLTQNHRGRLLDMTLTRVEIEDADGGRLVLPPEQVRHISPECVV